jgi:hypothetical protein
MVAQALSTLLEVVERRCDQLVTGLCSFYHAGWVMVKRRCFHAERKQMGEEPPPSSRRSVGSRGGSQMNAVIYLVGLVVVVMFILSFVGLR